MHPGFKRARPPFGPKILGGLLVFCLVFSSGAGAGNLRFSRITSADGLSQSQVFCILQDQLGFMWFGTRDGLNRYDGYSFEVFRHDPNNPTTISDHYVYALHEDAGGLIWIGTRGGLNSFDPKTETFTRYKADPEGQKGPGAETVSCIIAADQGRLWLGTLNGLSLFDPATGSFQHFRHNPEDPESLADNEIWALLKDDHGNLWVGTQQGLDLMAMDRPASFQHFKHRPGNDYSLGGNRVHQLMMDREGAIWVGTYSGLSRMDNRRIGRFTNFENDPENPQSIGQGRVQAIFQDRSGRYWVGTMGGGLSSVTVDGNRLVATHYRYDASDEESFSHNSVWSIYQDRTGMVWVGTFGNGINRFNPDGRSFYHIKYSANPGGLSHNSVSAFANDPSGDLWVGTFGGGLNYMDHETGQFSVFRHDPADPNSLGDNTILSLMFDDQQRLWIGTFNRGVSRLDYDSQGRPRFVAYPHDPNNPQSLGHNEVRAICQDRGGHIWVGNIQGGLNRYIPRYDGFIHFTHNPADPNSLVSNNVTSLLEDRDGHIWVGTWGEGLDLMTMDSAGLLSFTHLQHRADDPSSLGNNVVYSLFQDSGGVLWVGTSGGLSRLMEFNPAPRFRTWRHQDGLPNEVIHSIVEDHEGFIWLSTNMGISRFSPARETFTNYDISDGLQSFEFKPGAGIRDSRGQIYFGGVNGFNQFSPEDVVADQNSPQVVLTRLQIGNQLIGIHGQGQNSPLKNALNFSPKLKLNWRQNNFSIKFAGLHYAVPQRIGYRYRLKGFEEEWTFTTADQRVAAYTNLDPGEYEFQVHASNKDGIWSIEPATLGLSLSPPPWRSWWAQLIYFLLFSGAVTTFIRGQARKLAYQQKDLERMRQLDHMKDSFLANTSHELRTPLNGIIGLAQSLLDGVAGKPTPGMADNLRMMISSGRRLATLVDDILDFSAIEGRGLALHREHVDSSQVVDAVLALSKPLVGARPIRLINSIPAEAPLVYADQNRLQQILHNLIGNAIKFTHEGSVEVSCRVTGSFLQISVTDTGIGIHPDKIDRIFESFEQVESSDGRQYEGTGLGLAITRNLIALHGGTIDVDVKSGPGTRFFFTIPMVRKKKLLKNPERLAVPLVVPIAEPEAPTKNPGPVARELMGEGALHRILIVDDDAVNRQVLVNHLSLRSFRLEQAADGATALGILSRDPDFDLILLDVMMPGLSGFDVCRRIRETRSSQDLPIIFLTAKARMGDRIDGLEAGANDYLAKPIDKAELLSRVQTQLSLLDANRNLERKVAERTRNLAQSQKELMDATHLAGMAEIATDVLHNLGNALNSMRITTQLLDQGVGRTRWFETLEKINQMLVDHQNSMEIFVQSEKGRKLPLLLNRVVENMAGHQERMKQETRSLIHQMEKINDVLDSQREYTDHKGPLDCEDLNQLVREVLELEGRRLDEALVTLRVELGQGLPQVRVSRSRLMRALVCLLQNAVEAIGTISRGKGQIHVRTRSRPGWVVLEVLDNGPGFPEENRVQLFSHGYSSKAGHRGFGLHYCANVMNETGGRIQIENHEEPQGALVVLEIPAEMSLETEGSTLEINGRIPLS